jgi:hypothetical protein
MVSHSNITVSHSNIMVSHSNIMVSHSNITSKAKHEMWDAIRVLSWTDGQTDRGKTVFPPPPSGSVAYNKHSHTCITRLPLRQRKSDLLRHVTS